MNTTITKTNATTTIEKSIVAHTLNGYEVLITAYRRIIAVGVTPFKSKIYFGVSYKGQEFGHNDMDRESLNNALVVINNWGHKL